MECEQRWLEHLTEKNEENKKWKEISDSVETKSTALVRLNQSQYVRLFHYHI